LTAWNKDKLFIHIPKTAGMSIAKTMKPLEGVKPHAPIWDPELPDLPTFTVVRNPYDRAVSMWKFASQKRLLNPIDPSISFQHYLYNHFTKPFPSWRAEFQLHTHNSSCSYVYEEFYPSIPMLDYITIHGIVAVDEIIRFEDLNIDVKENVSEKKINHYRDVYTEESKEFVSNIWKKDIEYFGYKF